MATEVKLPELGDGIESGDVLEIFVAVGDTITAGQDIIEMETDKATVPVPASVGGKVTKIVVGEGDTVPIGGTILEVEAAEGAAKPEPPKAEPPKAEAPKAEPPKAEAPKPTPPPAAPTPPPAEAAPPAPTPAADPPPAPVAASTEVLPAGPAIRRFAREVGVDLSGVTGSGDGGRITRDDILAVVRSAGRASAAAAPSSPTVAATPAAGLWFI